MPPARRRPWPRQPRPAQAEVPAPDSATPASLRKPNRSQIAQQANTPPQNPLPAPPGKFLPDDAPLATNAASEPAADAPTAEPPKTPEPPSDPQQPKLVVEPPEEPRIARKFDPLRFDLEQIDAVSIDQPEAEQVSEPLPAEGLSDDNPLEPGLPPRRVVELSDAPSVMAARSARGQLESQLPALSVQDMLLTDFLDLVASLAGVPISVAPAELQMAGIDPGQRVALEAHDVRLDDALAQVLKPLRLAASTPVGAQVLVARRDGERVRDINYPLEDLVGPGATAEDFAAWIEQLIAPESWGSEGGKIVPTDTQLAIHQTQQIHYQILFFLERIRLARQLPLKSRYPARLLDAPPMAAAIADRLAAPTTFTFSHETPLAEVARYWQSELGLAVFVDWPALAEANLWPDSRITGAIANQPWRTALDEVLTPLGLACAPHRGERFRSPRKRSWTTTPCWPSIRRVPGTRNPMARSSSFATR